MCVHSQKLIHSRSHTHTLTHHRHTQTRITHQTTHTQWFTPQPRRHVCTYTRTHSNNKILKGLISLFKY